MCNQSRELQKFTFYQVNQNSSNVVLVMLVNVYVFWPSSPVMGVQLFPSSHNYDGATSRDPQK